MRIYPRHFDIPVIKKLLAIGVPSSVESSIFQVGKILVLGVVAGFGTSATTANAVAGSVTQFSLIPVNAIGTAMIIIIGQCVGANAYDQAVSYTKKLMLFSHGILAVTCSFLFFACPVLLPLYHLTPGTFATARLLVRFHCVCTIFLYPASFVLTNTLRAASDVKYPMVVSTASMWIWRIAFLHSRHLSQYGSFRRLGGDDDRRALPGHMLSAPFPQRKMENSCKSLTYA